MQQGLRIRDPKVDLPNQDRRGRWVARRSAEAQVDEAEGLVVGVDSVMFAEAEPPKATLLLLSRLVSFVAIEAKLWMKWLVGMKFVLMGCGRTKTEQNG